VYHTGERRRDARLARFHQPDDRARTSENPIAAYCRANEALATAANRYLSAGTGNGPGDRTAPSISLTEQVVSAILHAIIPSVEAAPGETEQDRLKAKWARRRKTRPMSTLGLCRSFLISAAAQYLLHPRSDQSER
jgi:hypothetical protein